MANLDVVRDAVADCAEVVEREDDAGLGGGGRERGRAGLGAGPGYCRADGLGIITERG